MNLLFNTIQGPFTTLHNTVCQSLSPRPLDDSLFFSFLGIEMTGMRRLKLSIWHVFTMLPQMMEEASKGKSEK